VHVQLTEGVTDGVRHPEAMLKDYAITPDLVRAFDQSLAMVKASIDGRRSAAAYVHGSFGSGKSHFMSVLSLMLSPDARQTITRGGRRSCTRCG
jgi:ABC-type polar amino acid transport system ATPase subunit